MHLQEKIISFRYFLSFGYLHDGYWISVHFVARYNAWFFSSASLIRVLFSFRQMAYLQSFPSRASYSFGDAKPLSPYGVRGGSGQTAPE